MSVDPPKFFESRQGAAVLKHGILRNYLAAYTGKLGSTAPNATVYFLDAYAGPGEYDQGEPGSPGIASETAQYLSKNRNLVGIYVEEDRDNLAKLRPFMANSKHQHHIFDGTIEKHLDEVLKIVGDAPLLAFFDPFGLTVPMQQLARLMLRPARGGGFFRYAPTDLIINVSLVGIGRVCGMLNTTKGEENPTVAKMRVSNIARANATFGGEWWQPIAAARSETWKQEIAHGYAQRLHEALGVGFFHIPVRDRPGGNVPYNLLLVSRYTKEAHWLFHECVSQAMEKWRAFNDAQNPQPGLPLDESQWIATIKANIIQLLRAGEFVIRDEWQQVYGSVFGYARGTHVRTAIKQLFTEEVTLCNGVSGSPPNKIEIPDMKITRGPKAPPLNT